ncbi:MAG TPA: aspartyl protease family protein [Pyrinomonadaceae bacterium]|nr:aspartyl protease family protein [Pyrinomonadaceae bacterium]
MGRIIILVTVSNTVESEKSFRFDAMVDTGVTYLTLPDAWKERLGDLEKIENVDFQTANGEIGTGAVHGPVRIQLEGFRPIFSEVLFIEMRTNKEGNYEPLVGYIPLEQIPVAVDMLGHRLVKVRAVDLK